MGNVDVLKHADSPKVLVEKKVRKKSTMSTSSSKSGKGKQPPVSWKNFLLKVALAEEDSPEVDDPTWEPPENFEDSDDADIDISEDEINDLIESMKTEVKITDFLPDKNIVDAAVAEN